MRLRGMVEADLDAVVRIQAACYTAIVPESAASLAAKLRAAPATCLVAADGPAVTGYLLALPVAYPALPALDAPTCEVPSGADALYLHDLALAPAARGTGAASGLVDMALAHARALGWRRACLVAIQQSQAFWERFGFRAVPEPAPELAAKLRSYGADAQLMTVVLRA